MISIYSESWCVDPWSRQPNALKWLPNDLELSVYFAILEILSFSYLVRINKNNIFIRLHYQQPNAIQSVRQAVIIFEISTACFSITSINYNDWTDSWGQDCIVNMTGALLRLFDDVTNIVFTYSIWGVIVMIRNMQIIDSKWDLSKFSSVGDWLVSNLSYQKNLKIFFANDDIAQNHFSESYSLIYITCITLFILNFMGQ